jgi:hypothetical protein
MFCQRHLKASLSSSCAFGGAACRPDGLPFVEIMQSGLCSGSWAQQFVHAGAMQSGGNSKCSNRRTA